MKTVVITGGSKGIGLEMVRQFSKDYNVVALSRGGSNEVIRNVSFVACDVTDFDMLSKTFLEIASRYGGIDILINNAGFGISGSVEYTDISDAKKIVDINFLGVFYCCKVCLKYLRQSKGAIVNISSVAGALAIPYQAFYTATKSAVVGFSNALRNEVRPFGIRVLTILPGDARTNFTSSRKKNSTEFEYEKFVNKSVGAMEKDEQTGMSAEYVARKIYRYTVRKKIPLQKTVGNKYKLFVFLSKILPYKLVDKLLYAMYGGQ